MWNGFLKGRKSEQGLVAVEFALLAVPFFTLIIGIIEASLFFSSGIVLEGAASDAARLIRTGQAQTSADPQAAFEAKLCDEVGIMIDCADIQYEVIHINGDTFTAADQSEPQFDENGYLVPQGFNAGNSNDVILIRAVYRYEFLTPYLGSLMTGDASRNWINHMATVVLRAEPYNFGEQ